MTSRFLPALALLAVVAAGGAYYLVSGGRNVDAPVLPPPDPPRPSAAPLLSAPAPTRAPTRPQGMIRYPDGTYMPALNGVTTVPGLQWPGDLPFSPIIGKRLAGGTEWYVHADGTQTTVMMSWRSDLGRDDAVCHVARPMPVAPEEPPDAPPGSTAGSTGK